MARVFISGSAQGLGLMAGRLLADWGHEVILHGRNAERAAAAHEQVPQARAVIIGDLSTIAATKDVAAQVNALGSCDAVIHNAAVGYQEAPQITADGLPHLFAINTLSVYVLTALIAPPKRLIYMSSGMHKSARAHIDDLTWKARPWRAAEAYAQSKLHDTMLAFAIARRWPDVRSNAVEPGWVATRMGGPGAPDDLAKGAETQAWLAAGEDPTTQVSGRYFFHKRERDPNPEARDEALQDQLIAGCERLSGVTLPD